MESYFRNYKLHVVISWHMTYREENKTKPSTMKNIYIELFET